MFRQVQSKLQPDNDSIDQQSDDNYATRADTQAILNENIAGTLRRTMTLEEGQNGKTKIASKQLLVSDWTREETLNASQFRKGQHGVQN